MLRPHGPDGSFEIEGPLTFHSIGGVMIDGLELDELIGQRLFGSDHEGAAESVRITVEVIDR